MIRKVGIAVLLTVVSLCARTARAQANLSAGACSLTNVVGAPPGGSIPVSFSFANNGPSAVTDFSIYEGLGSYLTIGSIQHVPAGVNCTISNANTQFAAFQCLAATFPVTQDSISIVLNVKPDAPPEVTLPLGVSINGSNVVSSIGCGRDQNKTVYVLGPSDPYVSGIQFDSSANAGTTLSGSTFLPNTGPNHCRDAVVTITMTNGNTLLPLSNVKDAQHEWTCSGTTQVVCTEGVIPAGGSAIGFSFSTLLSQSISGTVVTKVTVSSPEDTNTNNNVATATTTINPPPPTDVSVTIGASPAHPLPGENVTYTVGVSNSAAAAALGVTLAVSDSAGFSQTTNIGTMAAGESHSYVFIVHAPNTPGPVTATATVSAVNDSNSANNQASTQFVVTPRHADLGVAINAPAVVHPGTAPWTFVVSNAGPDDTPHSALSFQLPAGTTFSSFVGGTASFCSISGSLVSCAGPSSFPASAIWTATVQLNVLPSAPSSIHAVANVSTTDVDPNSANNSASADTRFVASANPNVDLSLSMTATPSVLHPSDMITLNYIVANHGGITATGVVLHTTYPSNITFVSGPAGCDATGCTVGTLTAGQSATFTIYATASMLGYDTATANATSNETDPNLGDNSAAQTIVVTPLPSTRRRSSRH